MLTVDQSNLNALLIEAVYNANAILFHLSAANDAVPTQPDKAVIRANYRAVSQIFDDLVRLADTAETIHTSVIREPEISP